MRCQRVGLMFLMVLVSRVCWPSSVFGADLANPQEFVRAMDTQGMLEKLGRGTSNALTGWAEIPYNIDAELSSHRTNGIAASVIGLVKGCALGIRRTAVGVYEVLTFWAPVPEGYVPIIPEPQYFGSS